MKQLIFIAALALLVTGCGGGGSSSDASGAGTRYSGVQNITFSANGTSSASSVRFVMVVNDDTVFITDEGNPAVTARGTLNGGQFTATGNSTGTVDGITCTFRLTYTGTVADGRTQGNFNGTAPCVQGGATINFTVSGSFSATSGSGKILVANGMLSELRGLLP